MIPDGWAKASLSEVVVVNPKHKDLDDQVAGFVPMALAPTDFNGILNYEERQWDKIKKGYTHFATGDVIFAKVTPCFENGKAAIVKTLPNGIGAGSTEFYVLRPAIKDISVDYIFSVIKSYDFLQTGAENMTGAVGLRRVPKKFVEDYKINLPPLAEQKVIADKLDELLAQVESTKARLDAIPVILKSFRQSVLAAAVSGKLTEEWRKGANYTSPKETWPTSKPIVKAFEIPNSWLGVSLGSVSDRVSVGHVGKTTEFYTDESSGVPLLRSQNVRPGKISKKGLAFITPEFHRALKKSQLKAGDLLVVRVGANRGDACVLPEMFEQLNCANIVFARPLKGLSAYLNIYFQSPISQSLLLGESVGGAQGVINTKSVERTFLALPSIEEQTEIVRRVEELFAFADKVEAQVNEAQTRVNNLTQSILAKAFRGELTAEWRAANPALITGENSAEALLERIKAEREALALAAKAAKKKPRAKKAKA